MGLIRIAGKIQDSIVDGPGLRYTIFVQGCPHNCLGCHNPDTHDFNGGTEFQIQTIIDEISKNTLLDGVTFSGGEPFSQAAAIIPIARYAKDHNLSVWIYSGWTYEELLSSFKENPDSGTLLSLCDVLVDGRFELDKKSMELQWKGSSNQRIIDLKETIAAGKVKLYKSKQYLEGFTKPKWS